MELGALESRSLPDGGPGRDQLAEQLFVARAGLMRLAADLQERAMELEQRASRIPPPPVQTHATPQQMQQQLVRQLRQKQQLSAHQLKQLAQQMY